MLHDKYAVKIVVNNEAILISFGIALDLSLNTNLTCLITRGGGVDQGHHYHFAIDLLEKCINASIATSSIEGHASPGGIKNTAFGVIPLVDCPELYAREGEVINTS